MPLHLPFSRRSPKATRAVSPPARAAAAAPAEQEEDGAATITAADPQPAPHGHRPPKGGPQLELDRLVDGRTVAVTSDGGSAAEKQHQQQQPPAAGQRPTPPPLVPLAATTPHLFPERLLRRPAPSAEQDAAQDAAARVNHVPFSASELTPEALRLEAIASAAAAAARAEEQRQRLLGRARGGALPPKAGPSAPRLPPRPDPFSTTRPTASLRMRRQRESSGGVAGAASSSSSSSAAATATAYRPRHVKTNYVCTTPDGWRLHLVRTRRLHETAADSNGRKSANSLRPNSPAGRSAAAASAAAAAASAAAAGGLRQPPPPPRHHPVILVPGLGSSGAYCFDLSPGVSLPDFLADRGWDVWTVELRGNGASDKPGLLTGRSRWWTVDTHVERDLPALLKFVLRACGPSPYDGSYPKRAHVLGHSMGGMALCGLMARADRAAARVRSVCSVGSGLFLEDSDWRFLAPMLPISHLMPWTVPSGALLRAYGNVMFTAAGAPPLDALYFVSTNVDHDLARAMMRRNWSDLSVGVVRQVASAFGARGLLSADGKTAYADPGALGRVAAPALFICGDEDRMCPPGGAKRTADMWGAALVAEHYSGCGGGSGGRGVGRPVSGGGRAECPASGPGACPYGARFVLCGPGSPLPVVAGQMEEQRRREREQPSHQRPAMLQVAAASSSSSPSSSSSAEPPNRNRPPHPPPPPPPHFRDHYGHFDILMGLRVEAEVFPAIARFFEDHDAPEMPALMLATPPVSPRL